MKKPFVYSTVVLLFWATGCGLFDDLGDIQYQGTNEADSCEDPDSLLDTFCGPCDLDRYVCEQGRVVCDGATSCTLDGTTLVTEGRTAGIQLSWDPVDRATGYQIRRDDEIIATVTTTSYLDDAKPGEPGEPQEFLANFETPGEIWLSWEAAVGEDGPLLSYQVSATAPDERGPWSTARSDRRAAPIPLGYEVRVADGDWVDVGTETQYQVPADELPPASLEATVTTEGFDSFVEITTAVSPSEPTQNYSVRGVFSDQDGPVATTEGAHFPTEYDMTFQRTNSADINDDYHPLSDCSEASCEDYAAPEGGASRYYRVVINSPSFDEDYVSPAVEGSLDNVFCGGAGTEVEPIEVCDVPSFLAMRSYTGQAREFLVTEDIDLTNEVVEEPGDLTWNGRLRGEMDGDNDPPTIQGLNIDGSGGLFAIIDEEGLVEHLRFESPTIGSNTGHLVGVIAGVNRGTIQHVHLLNGDVTGQLKVGGLVGDNQGLIHGVQLTAMKVRGGVEIGGVAGISSDTIDLVVADVDVAGDGNWIGGIVGLLEENGLIIDSEVHGIMDFGDENPFSLGGLVGRSHGTISDSSSTVDIIAPAGTAVGGLVGTLSGWVDEGASSGRVEGNADVGGLVGAVEENGTIENSQSSSDVDGANHNTGGLVGILEGEVSDSESSGSVNGAISTGGLVGLVASEGSILRSWSSSDVNGTNFVGGLAGDVNGDIVQTYATGEVESRGNSFNTGGLVGRMGDLSATSIRESFSLSPSVTGNGSVGGLVGTVLNGTLEHSFSRAQVVHASTDDSRAVGGLVGTVTGGGSGGESSTVRYSIAATEIGDRGDTYGGLVGSVQSSNTIYITNCFWNEDASGLLSNTGTQAGFALSEADFHNPTNTMSALVNFDDIWNVTTVNGLDYIWLKWSPYSDHF